MRLSCDSCSPPHVTGSRRRRSIMLWKLRVVLSARGTSAQITIYKQNCAPFGVFFFSFPFYFLTIPRLFLDLAKHQINFAEMLGSHKSINGETPGNVSLPPSSPQVGFQMIQAVCPNLSHHITVQITANKLRKKNKMHEQETDCITV